MVKNTTLSKFQEAQRSHTDRPVQYATFEEMHAAIRADLTATSPLGEIVGRVRRMANEQGIEIGEVEIRDLAERIQTSLQAAESPAAVLEEIIEQQNGESITPSSNYLTDLAQKMVRNRPAGDGHVGDPFDGMELDVDPADAFGLVQAAVTGWLEERGRWASEIEVRHKVDQLMFAAQSERPGPIKAGVYTVEAGVVTGFTPDPAPAELPEMPAQPEPMNALKVPSDSIFGDDGEFVVSQPLTNRARVLIDRHPEHLQHLEALSVIYLWKQSGGKSKGRATFGKCSKPSGLLKHFSESHFVIWLAADHCRAAGYRDRELEALLFHEMLHTAVTEPDENTGRGGGPALVPHELEVFRAEVEIYGLWAPELKEVGPAFQQVSLFSVSNVEIVEGGIFGDPSEDLPGKLAAMSDEECVTMAEEAGLMGDIPADAPLVCSICGNAVDEDEMSPEEVSEARQNPAVVLCESCGEDGVIEGDD